MNSAPPSVTVSAVITVYNKAPFLPTTIKSLRRQMADENQVEYVFVDDASTDQSVQIIRDQMRDAPHVRIITNAENCGPSIRLNQGALAASGQYLYFLDGDDLAVDGAMAGMLDLLKREKADLIYGKTRKGRTEDLSDLLNAPLDRSAAHTTSEKPLAYIMKGGFVRMSLMCERTLFLKAGGADERIFVQDESLPLRLCAHAKRFIDWQAIVTLMPLLPIAAVGTAPVSKLSDDKTQQHHDGFFAHANILGDVRESHPDVAPKLYAKAVSAYWKYGKRQGRLGVLHPGFWRYLQAKCLNPTPKPEVLAWMAKELRELPNIRRPKVAAAPPG